jgi:hypothetical protein
VADYRDDLWHNIPAVEYIDPDDYIYVRGLFEDFIEGVLEGKTPQSQESFDEFLDFMGLDENDFPWDDFRDWYNEL